MKIIKVIKPGMFTTIQDGGRFGYQEVGVPVSGAMDLFSMKVANMLVGNKDHEACIETTFLGPELEFFCNCIIAITGGDMSPEINHRPVEMWSVIHVSRGDILSFGSAINGCRSYIAIKGGIDIPVVMGSKSTYTRGKIGGVEGRALKINDELRVSEFEGNSKERKIVLPNKYIPQYKIETTIRVILGPQHEAFCEKEIKKFLDSNYTVTNDSDRMGYRLEGAKIAHKTSADIVSDGIAMGSIQVPGHGLPIIMMADRQTTGGYTKIATIITPDIDKMAQKKMGDKIRFEAISIEKAHQLYKEHNNNLEEIRKYINTYDFNLGKSRTYSITVNSKKFYVTVKELT